MAEVKAKVARPVKAKKLADPVASSIDVASQEMIARAQKLGVETIFDRAVNMKPCNIGVQGICCKNCSMGPCRLPLPKGGIVGEDTRKGLCGATANTIAARNFVRMIAGGAAAHSDHGRSVAEVFLAAAKKKTDDYKIKDYDRLLGVAPYLGVATTVEVDGEVLDRDLDEIAVEFAEKAMAEWGKPEGELTYAKRAPAPLYEKWKKAGVIPRNIDREIVEIMHRTHMGVEKNTPKPQDVTETDTVITSKEPAKTPVIPAKEKTIVAKTVEKKVEVKTVVQDEQPLSIQTPKRALSEGTKEEVEAEKTLLSKLKSAVLKRLRSRDQEEEEKFLEASKPAVSENTPSVPKNTLTVPENTPDVIENISLTVTYNTSEEEIVDHLVEALKQQDLAFKNRDKFMLEIEALIQRALDDRFIAIENRKEAHKIRLEERDIVSKTIIPTYTINPGE